MKDNWVKSPFNQKKGTLNQKWREKRSKHDLGKMVKHGLSDLQGKTTKKVARKCLNVPPFGIIPRTGTSPLLIFDTLVRFPLSPGEKTLD